MNNGQRKAPFALVAPLAFVLNHLTALTTKGMCSALLLALASGVPYVLFPSDAALRQTIYSLTGQVFWKNFYVLLGLGAAIVFVGVDFERRTQGKIYFQKDKLMMAAKLYQDAGSTAFDRASSLFFGIAVILFSVSFGLEIGLGVLKSFILK